MTLPLKPFTSPQAGRFRQALLTGMLAVAAVLLHPGASLAQDNGRMAGKLAKSTVPAGVKQIPDIAYGSDPRQRMDAYLPAQPVANAPLIVMVHGGAWMVGNKAMSNVTDTKVAHWVQQQGYVLVSVGYRLSPQVDPLVQARDVAAALAKAQSMAPSWGADPGKVILMGHSAGAHLVALLGASPALAAESGARPWRGTIALDSAALNLENIMGKRHMRFYDRVFGADPAYWRTVSPISVLQPNVTPMLLVCSTQRADGSCAQSGDFANAVKTRGGRATVLPQDLNHEQVNNTLGLPGAYTDAVDGFIAGVLAGT